MRKKKNKGRNTTESEIEIRNFSSKERKYAIPFKMKREKVRCE